MKLHLSQQNRREQEALAESNKTAINKVDEEQIDFIQQDSEESTDEDDEEPNFQSEGH